jgi:hypothetical protein
MKKLLMIAAAVLALSACDQNPQEARERATNANEAVEVPSVSGASTPAQATPQAQSGVVGGAMVNTPVSSSSPAMQNTPAPTVAQATAQAGSPASTCGADQSWVGQPLKSIDLSKITGVIRTIYPNQPVTMDYSDQRLNIILEPGTDKVLEVKCG